MASDPRFGDDANQYVESPDQFNVTAPPRSRWSSCLTGCLIVFGIMLIVAIVLGIWISHNWRDRFADIGMQAFDQSIESANLPPQEKAEVKAQVERVEKAFREGQITNKQAFAIIDKLMKSPLMPSLLVAAVDKQYFDHSGLSNGEKLRGREALRRFASGAISGKINQQGIDAVLSHVAVRGSGNNWTFRQKVSDADLRAALTEAKTRADSAAIPEEAESVDPSDELKRIIDEALKEH
jgi:hypothetical protein